MIAYLPADDPQIAIGIVVEYGGYGARTGDLVVDIANAYFAMKDGTLTSEAEPAASADQNTQTAGTTDDTRSTVSAGGAAANTATPVETAAPADRTAEKTGEDVAQEGQPVQEQTTALPQPEEQTQPGPVQTTPENDPPAGEEEAE